MQEIDLNFAVSKLGEGRITSPVTGARFVSEGERVLYHSELKGLKSYLDSGREPPGLEMAGPREKIFFDPTNLKCGIVTCGGLCPGLNDVIRSITLTLTHQYGVKRVLGFRYGYEGLSSKFNHAPLELTPEAVRAIHETGGTILGSSRGSQDIGDMVDTLTRLNIGILFAIGGDGTLRGAQAIAREVGRRGLKIGVIGIPKTIDNDISFTQKTFGFDTAGSEARRAINAAHCEAEGARNGIGLVKLMGRDSGFIATFAALANSHVNFCLVPEVPFKLQAFLKALEERLAQRGHAVIVVAEGAGQDLLAQTSECDASGNVRYGDIGIFLKDRIKEHFSQTGRKVELKYIDPSYTIRSLPADAWDSAFCLLLGQYAVHAGMAGRTDMIVAYWNHQGAHVPISLAVSQRKKLDPEGWIWNSVLAITGQPRDLV
ncbi:MAG: ATP-dependent 6-phosphofructokinase [Deltaproteobacteria bacterium]|nr:ATP-dependent 6-phosphofructokinase [Deltaproteobacteria bacterium]